MKTALKVIALGISLMALSINIQAQNHKNSEHKKGEHRYEKMNHNPEMMLERLDSRLNLNKTQEKRVFTLLEQNFEKRNAFKKRSKDFRQNQKQEVKSELARILNKDQMAKLEKMHQEKKAEFKRKKGERKEKGKMTNKEHKDRKGHGDFRKHLEKMKSKLDLTKEQENQVSRILESKQEVLKQRKSEMRAHKEKMKSKFGKDMKAILSPDQFEKFKVLQKEYHRNEEIHPHKF